MPIKNYTTTIDVYKSLGEIQGALAGHGACKIMVDYGATVSQQKLQTQEKANITQEEILK